MAGQPRAGDERIGEGCSGCGALYDHTIDCPFIETGDDVSEVVYADIVRPGDRLLWCDRWCEVRAIDADVKKLLTPRQRLGRRFAVIEVESGTEHPRLHYWDDEVVTIERTEVAHGG